jgi:hypothetical protein
LWVSQPVGVSARPETGNAASACFCKMISKFSAVTAFEYNQPWA